MPKVMESDPMLLHEIAEIHPLPWHVKVSTTRRPTGDGWMWSAIEDADSVVIYQGAGEDFRVKLQQVMVEAVNAWGKASGLVPK